MACALRAAAADSDSLRRRWPGAVPRQTDSVATRSRHSRMWMKQPERNTSGVAAEASEAEVRVHCKHGCRNRRIALSASGSRASAVASDARFAGWRLSSARTQWGSCSRDGRVRLSWRLIHFSPPVIDYVIAHELAHLRELNHSPRFWREVARLLPGFEAARDQIKRVESRRYIVLAAPSAAPGRRNFAR